MNDKTYEKKKKAAQTKKSPQITDVFTVICKTDIGVTCVKELKFHPVRKWRFDYAIPDYKVALEVEGGVWSGGRHTSSKGFLGDMEKYNTATLMGWKVLRTTPDELYRLKTIEMVKNACFNTFLLENSTKTDKKMPKK